MKSQKPYLINAIYEWCIDNDYTPYLASSVDKNTQVPLQYVQDGQILLNISPTSAKNLIIDKIWITFRASFNGVSQDIAIPVSNVVAIFAKENGQGMQFNAEPFVDESKKVSEVGGLKLVK